MNAFIDVVHFNHHLILIFTLLTYSCVKCSDLFTYYHLQSETKNKLQLCVMLQH